MGDRVKIYTFVGLIVVFSLLFLLSIKWRKSELPQIRYCCQNQTCNGFDTIKAMDIDANWNHDTRFKVVKGMKCDLGFYERAKFFIKKNGYLAFSEKKSETQVCNQEQYCLEKKELTTVAMICNGETCDAPPNVSIFWSINFIVVPLIVLMVFIYVFVEKIGKIETNIMLCYIVHLAVLHICLGITKLFHHKLNGQRFLCSHFTYLFYYSIISCFSWLLLMCLDVFGNLKFCKTILRLDSGDEMTQNNIQREMLANKRFFIYGSVTMGCSILATIIIFLFDLKYRGDDYYYCLRFQFEADKAHFDYSFVPFIIVVSCAMILYALTNTTFPEVARAASNDLNMSSSNKNHMKAKIDHETKRFMTYLRLFLVMLISWLCFYIIDSLNYHVVTVMNTLHIVALISLLKY